MKSFNFVLALTGNIVLVWLFWAALLNPVANAQFITSLSVLFFVFEFLSLHASGMFGGLQNTRPENLKAFKQFTVSIFGKTFSFYGTEALLIAFYFLFAITYAVHFNNWTLTGMFAVSVLSKFFGRQALSQTEQGRLASFFLCFLGAIVLVVLFQGLLLKWFPFPTGVFPGGGGMFERVPQTIVAWGVLYYALCALVECRFFFKQSNVAPPTIQ